MTSRICVMEPNHLQRLSFSYLCNLAFNRGKLRGIKILKAPQCSCLTPLPVITTDPGHRTLSIAMKTDGKCPPPLVLPMKVQGLVVGK